MFAQAPGQDKKNIEGEVCCSEVLLDSEASVAPSSRARYPCVVHMSRSRTSEVSRAFPAPLGMHHTATRCARASEWRTGAS